MSSPGRGDPFESQNPQGFIVFHSLREILVYYYHYYSQGGVTDEMFYCFSLFPFQNAFFISYQATFKFTVQLFMICFDDCLSSVYRFFQPFYLGTDKEFFFIMQKIYLFIILMCFVIFLIAFFIH